MIESDNAKDLSGAYALGAVSQKEREAYEVALRASDDARNEATELQDTAVLLGLAVEPVAASAELRSRLLAQIAVTPQRAVTPPLALAPQPIRNNVDAAPGPAETKAGLRWSRPATTFVSIAAALGLIVGGVAVGTTALHPDADRASQMAAISTAPDVEQVDMSLASGEKITLRWSPQLASSVIIVDGMAPAPSDSVYQLWYIGETGPRSAGFLPVTEGVDSWQVLEGDMHAGDQIGVTVEPEGGSPEPSGDPIMVIDPV